MMKGWFSSLLTLSLMCAGYLPAVEAAQATASILRVGDDGYLSLDCKLRPIERQSKAARQGACNLYKVDAPVELENSLTSHNWSGYVAVTGCDDNPNPTYGSVTNVIGSWTVPEVVSSVGGDTYSAAWVGMDGFVNTVVEQIGTEHDVIGGEPSYYAWFELYPADVQLIEGFPVNPGDEIEGQVKYEGVNEATNNVFHLFLTNHTQKVRFDVYQATLPGNPAHLSSANWIVEAPAMQATGNCIDVLPLANFGVITFKDCSAVIDGRKGPIGSEHWTNVAISMVTTGSVIKDIPSSLIPSCNRAKCKRDGFSLLWENTGPFPFDTVCSDG